MMRMDRRGLVAGMGAMLVAAKAPPAPAPPPALVKPPRLRPGDTVGLNRRALPMTPSTSIW